MPYSEIDTLNQFLGILNILNIRHGIMNTILINILLDKDNATHTLWDKDGVCVMSNIAQRSFSFCAVKTYGIHAKIITVPSMPIYALLNNDPLSLNRNPLFVCYLQQLQTTTIIFFDTNE